MKNKKANSVIINNMGSFDVVNEYRNRKTQIKTRELQNAILNSATLSVITTDENGIIQLFNPGAERMLGYVAAEVVNIVSLYNIFDPQEVDEISTAINLEYDISARSGFDALIYKASHIIEDTYELTCICKNGRRFPAIISITALSNHEGNINGYLFLGTDNSICRQAENVISKEMQRVCATLNAISDAVITTDSSGYVTYLNPVAEVMTGWTNREAVGLHLPEIFHTLIEHSYTASANPVELVLKHGQALSVAENTVLVQRSGTKLPIEESAAPIRNQDDVIIGVAVVFHDISQARKMASIITYEASHDSLTGLINRREFEKRLELVLQTGKIDKKQHTLLYLDLDQFKIVNDTCGHVAGDELLRQLTSVLKNKIRQSDTLARLGGDEFGVILEGCATKKALGIAEILLQTVNDFRFIWEDKLFSVGLSVGLVTFGNGFLTSLTDILRIADAACYVAKDRGRNRIHVYTPEYKDLTKRHGEMGWFARTKKALDEQRFVLFSQRIMPLVDETNDRNHYELLLRMKDEDGSLIPPMAFIPTAERYGLMPLIDRWVIKSAFTQYAARYATRNGGGTFSINLSATSICDDHFLTFILEQFEIFKVPPLGICFEIAETSAISNLSQAAELIRKLKAIGCRFSLDGFGSGMSSFAHLKHLPVDYLKIDCMLVKNMLGDATDYALVKAINHVGHEMGIQTIAECVENDLILDALKDIGIDFAQGYCIEAPQPLLVMINNSKVVKKY